MEKNHQKNETKEGKENTKGKIITQGKIIIKNIKKRIYNAYHRHWKILFLILIFYLVLLGLVWNTSSNNIFNQSGGNNQAQQMANVMEEMNPTGMIKQKRSTNRAIKALGSPFETTFKALWWVLAQLGSLISIILILIIVPSVPIVLYAGALYMVIGIMLDKVKKI